MFPVADMGGKACELCLFDGGVTVHEGGSEPVPDKRVIARQAHASSSEDGRRGKASS